MEGASTAKIATGPSAAPSAPRSPTADGNPSESYSSHRPPTIEVEADDNRAKLLAPICTASTPYMRRELVIWGDCVKLRYVGSIITTRLVVRRVICKCIGTMEKGVESPGPGCARVGVALAVAVFALLSHVVSLASDVASR